MKKILQYLSLPFLAMLAYSCTSEPLVFDHEQQAFETRSDMILIEGIMPQASTAEEEIYIIGAFNGGESAIGDAAYKMTHSSTVASKWGVYLNPSSFKDGKTLADGFTFHSVQQGGERSPLGEAVTHTLTIGPGEWANVYVDKWAKYFEAPENPEEVKIPEHSGVRVWIIDQTGWDAIALYMWGDVNNFGGDWPGMQVGGTETIGGVEYKYFEYGDDIVGLAENLIFNNNNNGVQLADYNMTFASGVADYWLLVTADGVSEAPEPGSGGGAIVIPSHDGVRVWVDDQTGWDAIALYMWGDVNNFGGDWPGMQVGGTETIGGVEYKYFEYGDDIVGLAENLIFNNNNNGVQLDDVNVTFAEGVKDYWFQATADGATQLEGPGGGGGGDKPDEPEPPVEQKNDPSTIYVQDLSGWEDLYLYMWGDKELCGGWPGLASTGTRKVGTVTYKSFTVEDALGRSENLIFNNDNGSQTADYPLTLPAEIFLKLDAEGNVSEVDPKAADIKIFVKNETNWPEIAVYAWGDAEAFGGWPGATPIDKEVVGDVEYTVFGLDREMAGKTINLIFNNNGGGKQLADFAITVPEDELFLNINASYTVGAVEGNPRGGDKKRVAVFVDDRTGWAEGIALYQWGNVNNLGGGWPGASAGATVTIGGTDWKVFFFEDALGLEQHLIFNNNGNNVQLPDYDLKFDKNEYFLTVTADGVSPVDNPTTSVVFAEDLTGWDALALYMWGDVNNLGGGWPGIAPGGEAVINGTTAKVFVVDEAIGLAENLIFNNNGGGTQLADYALKYERNAYYLTVRDSGVSVF